VHTVGFLRYQPQSLYLNNIKELEDIQSNHNSAQKKILVRREEITPMQNDVAYSEPGLVNGNKGGLSRRGDYMSWDIDTVS
jgi:hypothetical protein